MRFAEYLNRVFEHGEQVAFIDDESQNFTFEQMQERVADWTYQLGVQQIPANARVVVLADFDVESISLVLALFLNGNIVVPVSGQAEREIESMISVSGCDFVVRPSSPAWTKFEVRTEEVASDLFERLKQDESAGLVFFSSGTTGKPKGIVHSVDRVVSRFAKPPKRYVALPMLMFDHFGGFNTLLGMLIAGSTIVQLRTRSVEGVCEAIQKYSVSLLPTTPSFLSLMLLYRANARYDLSSLEKITYGTEPMSEKLLIRIGQELPSIQLQQTYGLSEVGVLASRSRSSTSTEVDLGGSGFETKIVDDVLWVKSEYAMLGYLNGSEEDFLDGWFNTQDRVEVVDGYMRILGRDTSMINVAGQKVMPIEIEEVLLQLVEVAQVDVYGESHPLLGQVVIADVVLSHAGVIQGFTRIDIQRYCRSVLASYKCPQRIRLVDEIGVTPRGKRRKKESFTEKSRS